MCGQCILHSTGLSCPMRCPKNLRNGPCGGVRANGNCEVYPDQRCVWVDAWEGSRRLPLWRDHIEHLQKPVDWQLQGTSPRINLVSGRVRIRLAVAAGLLGAAGLGVRNIVLMSGDDVTAGDHPEARRIYDIDSMQLVEVAAGLRDRGTYLSGRKLEQAPSFFIGAVEN